jgi:transcription antitermination factor NusG
VAVADGDEWVLLHCYAGYESDVIARITRAVPTADVRRLRRDSLDVPGYLVWRWDTLSWDAVRNAGGVTGFVGSKDRPDRFGLADIEGA